MPFVNLKLFGAIPTEAQVATLQEGLARLMARPLRKKSELTVVAVDATPGHASVGGVGLARGAWTGQLTAFVTAGTNTEEEKAGFQRLAHALLSDHFGEPSAPLYVVVQEVPSTDWGYGGTTQAARAKAALAA